MNMIETLSRFDRKTAAGLIARAALAMDDGENPSASPVVPDESRIRKQLLKEVYQRHSINFETASEEENRRILEFLDEELDIVLEPVDVQSELDKLSEKGKLPTDLYELQMDPALRRVYGEKWDAEAVLVKKTVTQFDQEQHFLGPEAGHVEPLISLFIRRFVDSQFVNRSFTLLVAGQRDGTKMRVRQVWRLYPDRIKLSGAKDLVELLRRFANEFGCQIEYRGQRGRFFLEVDGEFGEHSADLRVIHERPKEGNKMEVYFSSFGHRRGEIFSGSSLALAIDVTKYRRMLRQYGW